jgi:hypothetical protein
MTVRTEKRTQTDTQRERRAQYTLCCVVLCCVVLCCVVLCCVVLCCVVLRCVVLCCVALCCVALRCVASCRVESRRVALFCVVLCCVVLCCVALRCVVLCCVTACCIKQLAFYLVCSVLNCNQRVMFVLSIIYHYEYIPNIPVSLKQYHSLVLIPKYKFSCKRLVEHFIYDHYKLLCCCPLYWFL